MRVSFIRATPFASSSGLPPVLSTWRSRIRPMTWASPNGSPRAGTPSPSRPCWRSSIRSVSHCPMREICAATATPPSPSFAGPRRATRTLHLIPPPDYPTHDHRHLRRQLRSHHAWPRRSHPAQPGVRGSSGDCRDDERREAAAVSRRGAHAFHPGVREGLARRRAAVRRAPRELRARRRRHPLDPRTSRGGGLRVRVPDGTHESPPESRSRNGVHDAPARPDVCQLQPRSRGRALRRRDEGAREPGGARGTPRTLPERVSFIDDLRRRAAARRRRIAFPECGDERTQTAMHRLKSLGIVEPVAVLPSDAGELRRAFTEAEISCIAPAEDPRLAAVTDLLLRRRAARGLSAAEAGVLAQDPLFFADGLVALDEIDGCVAGAVHASAHVVRAALWCVGAAHAGATVSSAFYLALPARSGVPERVLTFTDCAVVPEPTSQQLVEIVLAAAAARRKVVGDEPRVALLSYSTLGSGSGSSVDRVRSAVALVRQQAPGLLVDGELQADAALVESVAMRKAPGSIVAGAANVLVFPSLDAGNIAYKLVERLVPAIAVGPVLQGIARPCSDLSRGAGVDDIINVAAVTALIADETGRVITGGIRRETDP